MREWEQIIPEEERKIYEKAGYKGKDSFGRNPALLVIDVIPVLPAPNRCTSWMPSMSFPPAAAK